MDGCSSPYSFYHLNRMDYLHHFEKLVALEFPLSPISLDLCFVWPCFNLLLSIMACWCGVFGRITTNKYWPSWLFCVQNSHFVSTQFFYNIAQHKTSMHMNFFDFCTNQWWPRCLAFVCSQYQCCLKFRASLLYWTWVHNFLCLLAVPSFLTTYHLEITGKEFRGHNDRLYCT